MAFEEWLGEVESKRPDKVFVRIRDGKDVVVGGIYGYEPWFRDGRVEFYGYLPAQSNS